MDTKCPFSNPEENAVYQRVYKRVAENCSGKDDMTVREVQEFFSTLIMQDIEFVKKTIENLAEEIEIVQGKREIEYGLGSFYLESFDNTIKYLFAMNKSFTDYFVKASLWWNE